MKGDRPAGVVRMTAGATAVAAPILATADLWQVAILDPGALGWDGVAQLVLLYLVASGIAALVFAVLVRGRGGATGWVRAAVVAVGGAVLALDVVLLRLSPLSSWRWAGTVAVLLGALVALGILRRLLSPVRPWLVVVVVGLFGAGAVGAARGFRVPARDHAEAPPAATADARARPNVVLVLIDTLRADHLGCYGYGRPTSPTLDALSREGALFTRAFSQSSWTKPATASLLTARYPSMHGAIYEQSKLPASEPFLPQLLRQHGYETGFLSGNPWITADYGFDRGVDHFVAVADERFARVTLFMTALRRLNAFVDPRARIYNRVKRLVVRDLSTTARDTVLTAAALRWIGTPVREPFFLYLHYMSPHHPYDPPPPFDQFVPDRALKPVTNYPRKSYVFFETGAPLPPAELEDMVGRYDGDILFVDTALGELLAGLRGRGLLDRTVVVVTADHGEEFYDHQNWGHGQSLYDELIHVPLLVRYPPAVPAGTRVDGPVMTVDVAPTLLEWAGAPPIPDAAGRTLLPALGGAAGARADAYSELLYRYGQERALVRGERKLIAAVMGDVQRRVLFDLRTDPGEQHDLASTEPGEATALATRLNDIRTWAERHAAAGAAAAPNPDTERQLRALGYLE